MSASGWRNLAAILAVTTCFFAWRNCIARSGPKPVASDERAATRDRPSRDRAPRSADDDPGRADEPGEAPEDLGLAPGVPVDVLAFAGVLMPRSGESIPDYRDRIQPLAEQAVTPYRARLDDARSAFESEARLDQTQRDVLQRELDAATEALVDRGMNAYMTGEVYPAVRASRVVTLARELLAIIDEARLRFRAGLTTEQQTALDEGGFDFAEYLLVTARWEDIIPGL